MFKGRSTGGRGNGATAHEPEDYDSVQLPNVNQDHTFYHNSVELPVANISLSINNFTFTSYFTFNKVCVKSSLLVSYFFPDKNGNVSVV